MSMQWKNIVTIVAKLLSPHIALTYLSSLLPQFLPTSAPVSSSVHRLFCNLLPSAYVSLWLNSLAFCATEHITGNTQLACSCPTLPPGEKRLHQRHNKLCWLLPQNKKIESEKSVQPINSRHCKFFVLSF